MTKDEYMALVTGTLGEVEDIVREKNHDYTGGSDDPFSNFRLAELEGVRPEQGIMVRTQDKFQRIRTFMNRGELKVDGEGIDDALHDVIGYMLLLKGMIKERIDAGDKRERWFATINGTGSVGEFPNTTFTVPDPYDDMSVKKDA